MNKRYKKKRYYNKFLLLVIVLIIGFLSVGYSAFSEDLVMRDIAVNVRVDANVRVTNFSVSNINNGALSNYEEYNVDNVTSSINLPNSNSSVRYKVEVTNFGNVDMGIFTITGLPDNLVYDVVDYEFKDKICNLSNSCTLGAKKEFYIDVMYKENGFDFSNTNYNLKLDFDFRRIYSVKYEGITNNNYPDSIMHGDTLRVNFTNSVPPKVIPYINGLKSKNYTFSNNEFIMNNVTNDVTLKYIDKVYLKWIDGDSKAYFHEDSYETKIKSVKFVNYVDTTDSLVTYDLSEEQNNEIIGWIDSNYNLFIGSDWNIYGKNLSYLFYQMTGISSISFNNLNTSEVTTMASMFESCKSISSLNLNTFVTSNVIDMSRMFYETGYNVSSFDISTIANWDVSKVTAMNNLFQYSGYNASIWNVGDLSNWDVSSLKSLAGTFAYAGYSAAVFNIGNIGKWNTSELLSLQVTFWWAGQNATTWYIGDLSDWNTSKVSTMYHMFDKSAQKCTSFNVGNIGKWDTSKVESMSTMFSDTGAVASEWYVGDLSNWDTSNVTQMHQMFAGAALKVDSINIGNVGNWKTSKVTKMYSMFASFGKKASKWYIGDLSNWETSSCTLMNSMFADAGSNVSDFNIGNLSDWNTSNVTDMSYMFASTGYNSSNFNIGDLSNWDTSNVTNMNSMFRCSGYLSNYWYIGNISSWNTSNVTNMNRMFDGSGYKSTYSLDLSGWNVSKVMEHEKFNQTVENKIVSPVWVN